MAEKKKRRVVKPATMREKLDKSKTDPKQRHVRKATEASRSRLSKIRELSAREYHPVKLPDNKLGRILSTRGHLFPRFFREAWAELGQVTWPNRRETFKLTTAVLIFAIIFGGLIAVIDLGLEKFFRNVILK